MTQTHDFFPWDPQIAARAKRVLTMERLSGVPLTDLDAIKLGPQDPQAMTWSIMLN